MAKAHHYKCTILWTGNLGNGTRDYQSYERSHVIQTEGKADIAISSDPAFRGDRTKHNPEELLVSSLSSCHMLWYLHLCAVNGVIVTRYTDNAVGVMQENTDGSGQFVEVTLQPKVTVASEAMIEVAHKLHHDANKMCFIARSMNFPVNHNPLVSCKT